MKKIFLCLTAILIFCIGEMSAQAYREVDKFTGDATIYSTKRRISLIRAKAQFFYINEEIAKQLIKYPDSRLITGRFSEWGHRRWKYLKFHALVFLIDGESIAMETDHSGSVGEKLTEAVSFSISWNELLKFLNADKVEYRLGIHEGKLKKKVLKEMRSFRDLLLKTSNQ